MPFSFPTPSGTLPRSLGALLVLVMKPHLPLMHTNPDIDGDGIPNTWEMKGSDADGDGKVDGGPPGMGVATSSLEMDYMPTYSPRG